MSNKGLWNKWFSDVDKPTSFGDSGTYEVGAKYLKGLKVEDWGCGLGYFSSVFDGDLVSVDGSHSKFADKIVDLEEYTSNPEGIFMRHVLEHNYGWKKILNNAVHSFTKRMCLIFFTPFSDETKVIATHELAGGSVPDLSFAERDILDPIERAGISWESIDVPDSPTIYGVERIILMEKL